MVRRSRRHAAGAAAGAWREQLRRAANLRGPPAGLTRDPLQLTLGRMGVIAASEGRAVSCGRYWKVCRAGTTQVEDPDRGWTGTSTLAGETGG